MPPLEGNLKQSNFFVYAAADTAYFDKHARPLINSIRTNTPDIGCHIHIYNPRTDQLEFCNSRGASYTYETVDDTLFSPVLDYWIKRNSFSNERQRQMYKKGQTLGPAELLKLIKQTYYACARFVRLSEILAPEQKCLALDVDGLVRAPFTNNLGAADFYLYRKPKDGTHLAGALLFNGTAGSNKFLQQYASLLRENIAAQELYWFLDQFILDQLVPSCNVGLLPMSYIDWAMKPDSAIWSAKGKRKELDIFKREQSKYQ
jgi:hypothetical protein